MNLNITKLLMKPVDYLQSIFNRGTSATLTTLRAENARLQSKLSEESAARTTATLNSMKYQTLAEEWQIRYTRAVESHLATLKSETNWFAMSTSTRLPMHDGVGPTRPPARDDEAIPQSLPITPKRLSTIAKEETRKTLDDAAAIQQSLLAKLSKDVSSLEPVNLDLTESAAKLYHDQWGEWPNWYKSSSSDAA